MSAAAPDANGVIGGGEHVVDGSSVGAKVPLSLRRVPLAADAHALRDGAAAKLRRQHHHGVRSALVAEESAARPTVMPATEPAELVAAEHARRMGVIRRPFGNHVGHRAGEECGSGVPKRGAVARALFVDSCGKAALMNVHTHTSFRRDVNERGVPSGFLPAAAIRVAHCSFFAPHQQCSKPNGLPAYDEGSVAPKTGGVTK